MAKSLFEAYKNRLSVANTVYSKAHGGETLSGHKKLVTAKCLENVNRFMNESLAMGQATQAGENGQMGMWKKFCLNLTTVAVPNLIAHDLVIVSPMSSMSGYITYVSYQYSADKGATVAGTEFNSPFALGAHDNTYTGARVVETIAEGQTELAWAPVIAGSVEKFVDGAWEVVEGEYTPVAGDKVRYAYDNIVIPQDKLPTIRAEVKSIALVAKARRIAVYYSQIAAYQAKTDYGFDLGDQLAEKAVGELAYEIDTEITDLLRENALEGGDELTWSKTLPIGVSKAEHYEGFTEILEIGKQKIYQATKKFAPNYVVAGSGLLPVLSICKGWAPAPAAQINGPYFAGTINNLKVFITPNFDPNEFVIGVNGNDMMSSAAVYAPYMTICPTQLLGFADGGMSQGFSTLYALEVLNKNLIVKGKITN